MTDVKGSEALRNPAPAAPRGKSSRMWNERVAAAALIDGRHQEVSSHNRRWSWGGLASECDAGAG
jgi:hypothetical protein